MILCNLDIVDKPKQAVLLRRLNDLGYSNVRVTYQTLGIELIHKAKAMGARAIILSNADTLANLVAGTSAANQSNWRGSVLAYSVPVLVINPLVHVFTTTMGEMILESDISKLPKLLAADYKPFHYNFSLCKVSDFTEARTELSLADCLVIDIETTQQNTISHISYTPLRGYTVAKTYQISLTPADYSCEEDLIAAWELVRWLNLLPCTKAMHNGKFDAFHLLRHQSAIRNYTLDTEYIWWCWYAEAKKSLAFIASMLLEDYYFWKEEAASNIREYNAKDTINTARVLVTLMKSAPDWVWDNYAKTMPNIIPAIYQEFEGFRVDLVKKESLKSEAEKTIEVELARLKTLTASETFNPASPQQVSFVLYKLMGATKPPRAKSVSATDVICLAKVALQHPILARFVDALLIYRKAAKAYSTYYCAELRQREAAQPDRLLYSVQLDGTQTGRFASSQSSLYSLVRKLKSTKPKNFGAQIQNQPPYMKAALIADSGYRLGNVDKSQSEARCTAVLSGDMQLYNDLYREPTETEIIQYDGNAAAAGDFYCRCTYRYFGRIINKSSPERQVTKKINHGTSYMMQENTFIDSVGIVNMQKAKKLLNRPATESLFNFAGHCLSLFHANYRKVSPWWDSIKIDIAKHGYYDTPDGWRRVFFGDPLKNHGVWRSAVAHGPQHFSVAGINKAIYRLYYQLQVPSNGEYRLKCQVHDSITFQANIERFDYYMAKTLEIMDIPQPVNNHVTLRIPLDAEHGLAWKGMQTWTPE